MTNTTTPARLLTAALLALLTALAITASPASAKTVTLEMKGKTDRKLTFSGPQTVAPGDTLAIDNLTDPMKVGPHSFTLLQKKLVPKTKDDARSCFGKRGVCTTIAPRARNPLGRRNANRGMSLLPGWEGRGPVRAAPNRGCRWATGSTPSCSRR